MKFKKLLSLVTIAALSIGIVGCATQAEETTQTPETQAKQKVIVGTSASYTPWAFQEADVVQGFEIDVWNEIAKRNNYELEFKLGQFSGLVGMLDAEEIDTVAHQMSITPERLEKYNFSTPYAYSYYDLFVANDSTYKTKDDLKGQKVGCWLGGNGEATLRKINEEHSLGFDIVTFDGASIEGELAIGRLAALWQGEIKTKTTIKENNLEIRQLNEKLVYETNAYPFRKNADGEKLSQEVSKAIDEMREDGTLEELSKKWFEVDTTKPVE